MGGSGEFAASGDIFEQIEAAKKLVEKKLPRGQTPKEHKYIAYFQSFSNTYVTSTKQRQNLINLYKKVINLPEIAALSLGTRPDCLDDELMEELALLNKTKPVWIELGLQTSNDETAGKINRGYKLQTFIKAYERLKTAGFTVIVHVIIGLPGEIEKDFYNTIDFLAGLEPPLDGIKIQLLQVLKGTDLERQYLLQEGTDPSEIKIYTLEEYGNILVNCLKKLSPQTVVHRFTGDGPKNLLIEPKWCGDKKRVLNYLNKLIENTD